jgi:hypothetical protein
MFLLFAGFLSFNLAGPTLPALVATSQMDEELYFATIVGDRMVYRLTDGKTVLEIAWTVSSVKQYKTTLVTYSEEINGFRGCFGAYGAVRVSRNGLHPDWIGQGDEPEPMLKLPAKPGDQWKWKSKFLSPSYEVTYTFRGEEEVIVPAGKFKALRVDSVSVDQKGGTTRRSVWYARGVGVIQISEGTNAPRFVLQSFTPGKGKD